MKNSFDWFVDWFVRKFETSCGSLPYALVRGVVQNPHYERLDDFQIMIRSDSPVERIRIKGAQPKVEAGDVVTAAIPFYLPPNGTSGEFKRRQELERVEEAVMIKVVRSGEVIGYSLGVEPYGVSLREDDFKDVVGE